MIRTTALLGLMLVGCGGGGRDAAADECDALFELVCNRVVECMLPGYTFDSCMDEINMALGPDMQCDDADQVSAGYPACMSVLMSSTCADLFPGMATVALPTECQGAILFEP
jgi:hypothetical protein